MKAFISYAHDDYPAFEEFSRCLKPVARAFELVICDDRMLRTGNVWNQKIADAIEASDIHVLLMSASFFGSDYIYEHELPAIAVRNQTGALTLPVLVERCSWYTYVGLLQAAPMNPKGRLVPIKEWKPQRAGFAAACEQIEMAIKEYFSLTPVSPFLWGKP